VADDVVVREYLDCPFCGLPEQVSPDDPDSAIAELDEHMRREHPDEDASRVWESIEVRRGR
jgi:hypothetical protein